MRDVERGVNKNREDVKAKCPECGSMMADMGLDFESPKKNDLKSWEYVRNLYISGITFHSCGCTGPGYIPRDYEALVTYLKRMKNLYIDQRRFWQHREEPTNDREKQKDWHANKEYLCKVPSYLQTGTRKKRHVNIQKAVEYWTGKINDIDAKLEELSKSPIGKLSIL
ncbi:hypothetical protein [Fulvivirga sediminis]|uniref:Uncharacterized protein n=1 Tax=Fulvivirga sediminis TaxID=2803949 RepID=A0A937FAZ4_9BACT|nr:hypothetical protein [Fulvivirga sediminis]MBL3657514.1 hypothetical protein [Fulvivirga sediminis]